MFLLIEKKTNNEEKYVKIRISEQEARFLMCNILNKSDYFYSIETPTTNLYRFSGKGERSAAMDLTLWQYNGKKFERLVNIEFKAHNVAEENIRKDIEKLVKENICGNWFHFLKNIDSGTLPVLFEKFINSFHSLQNELNITLKKEIVFTFCVLEKKWACIKVLTPEDNIEEFFRLDYDISQNQIRIKNSNSWEIFSNPSLTV